MNVHDLIGIGFGPSNVALAIALEEQRQMGRQLDTLFLEKQPNFAWHKDMLLEGTDMQISFLKDLATLRNPSSRFTFVNYLFEKGRLQDFINLKTFFPSRYEFNDYLAWAASHFDNQCAYGEEVVEIAPEMFRNQVSLLRVTSRDADGSTHERLTQNLVLGIGGAPNIPDCFRPLKSDQRVFHSSRYLGRIEKLDRAQRIAVIGAGQSAAEIFLDLHGRPNAAQVDLIMRGRAMHPSDDSPSVNEIFNSEFTDYIYSRTPEERASLLDEFRHTNYAAPDIDQIDQIFDILYTQKVTGNARHRLLTHTETRAVLANDDGIQLQLLNRDTGEVQSASYDAVILATGYTRNQHRDLLAPLAPYLADFTVDRHYRLQSTSEFKPAVFVQGASETSHGISDTLLSILAVRSREIGAALIKEIGINQEPPTKKAVNA
ncbi:lysine N(6)-hydroxylase/L-ornithine N(5)-oxygenase family protein [Microbulbifer taiwanensis]|uniref:Lysine N(6)-hydroxylase/L-ornithine N(5)-oxygenase family protein n=1 Tax=Microbulbifer taiwanensis TaxID=986746 RepID=A0ABW1YM74_9GAMM|nr:lysine N(6)-hydroxylase/L-ornithine N(5)-oxygenase family protein [Microbulbifer taiwanensis]